MVLQRDNDCELVFTDACGCFTDILYDYVINNGTIADPKTGLRTVANIGIKHGKVAVVTRADLQGKTEVDASGKIVCPGFVDPHNYADGQLPSARAMTSMGVTTTVIGSRGSGPYPSHAFLRDFYAVGHPFNCGILTPVSCVLREKSGVDNPNDTATDEQIATIANWVEEDLCEGSMGVSFSLEYAPQTTWDELIAVSKVAAKYDKVVSIHPQADGWNNQEAIDAILRLQEATGARILLSLNDCQCSREVLEGSLRTIEKAIRQGCQIAVDKGAYEDFDGADGKIGEGMLALQQSFVMLSSGGTYPKILVDMVREQNVLTLMDFVKKAAWMPAQLLGLPCKGWIGAGADADIVVIDLKRLKAETPVRVPGGPRPSHEGIDYVFVNGEPVVKEGYHVADARPGKALMPKARIWRL